MCCILAGVTIFRRAGSGVLPFHFGRFPLCFSASFAAASAFDSGLNSTARWALHRTVG